MDIAFEAGFPDKLKEIYQPWVNFNDTPTNDVSHIVVRDKEILHKARRIAMNFHPNWDNLSQGPRNMHMRNVFQVVGAGLNCKSDILVCWAPIIGNSITGGTRTAFEIARYLKIPVYNLNDGKTRELFQQFIRT